MRSKRKRVSKETVRDNAVKGAGKGSDYFILPEGVGLWEPKKAERYSIDMLPYEVTSKNHPDDVEKGTLWYKLPFKIHRAIGAAKAYVVCPKSIGKACPICEERDRLYKEDGDKYEDVCKALRTQNIVAYNILDPEDADKTCLFIFSRGKFAETLEDELRDADNAEHLAFFDVNEDGRTLRVRFSEKTFEKSKYLAASKIDFKSREEMDEDEILESTVVLEEALVVLPYDKLSNIFFQKDEEEEEEEEAPVKKTRRSRKKVEPEPEEEEEEEEEEAPPKRKRRTKKKEPEPEEEEEEEDDKPIMDKVMDEDEDCVACEGTGKNSRGGKCRPCKGTGSKPEKPVTKKKTPPKPDPEDEEEEEEEEEAPPVKKKRRTKKKEDDTPTCPAEDGEFGNPDKYDECDTCPEWDACEAAESEGKK